jgi:ATP10 protein
MSLISTKTDVPLKSTTIRMLFGAVFTAALLIICVIQNYSQEKQTTTKNEPVFPNVRGKNLLKRELNLPQDFNGDLNLVFIAFKRNQQPAIDTWIPEVKKLLSKFPKTRYYEVPTIKKFPGFVQSFINGGMRRGIPDQDSREATVTLYLDKKNFLGTLGITDEKKIYVVLVDRKGKIFGKWEDKFSAEKLAEIEKEIVKVFPIVAEN